VELDGVTAVIEVIAVESIESSMLIIEEISRHNPSMRYLDRICTIWFLQHDDFDRRTRLGRFCQTPSSILLSACKMGLRRLCAAQP
jgi:hypothetical protein